MMSFVKDVKVLPFLFVYLIRNFKEVVDELYPAYFPLQGLRLLSYELLKRGRKGIPYIDPIFLFKDVVNCVMAVVAGEIIHHEGFPFFLIIVFLGGFFSDPVSIYFCACSSGISGLTWNDKSLYFGSLPQTFLCLIPLIFSTRDPVSIDILECFIYKCIIVFSPGLERLIKILSPHEKAGVRSMT